ncbi:MAG: polyphosphate kinase 1 [Coriobacteriia bacterium]|nr:polyphosphate kinase 1 [Coriobacteriia bacterium]
MKIDSPESGLPEPEAVRLDDPSLFLNRELSLLAFQERVLEEAEDERNPLLERVKFLAIMSSNLGEFYMVRIGGLKQQVKAGVGGTSADGMTPAEQLAASRERAVELMRRGRVLYRSLRTELAAQNIHVVGYRDLDAVQRGAADEYFRDTAFPTLTPLAFDPGRPFPHISNMSLNLAIVVRSPEGEERFARLKLPRSLPRLVPMPGRQGGRPGRAHGHWFIWIDDLVCTHLASLFPGYEVVEAHAFRITRDAEIEIQEIEADDLLESIEEGIRKRRFGSVVRVTVDEDMPEPVRQILSENLELEPDEMVVVDPPLGFSDLFALYRVDRPDLKEKPFVPALPPGCDEAATTDWFEAIREHDIMLHRPFESFEPVVALLRQAANDPDVLAIKMTLYRVGRDAPVVQALLEAAENGKEVAALVELKARFDEESNIGWARMLEAAGVHVVYGLLGLKTHSKVTLIVRKEGRRIRRYVHVGTGNYNAVTSSQYTDLDLLTCREDVGHDATQLFNSLTGWAADTQFERFLVAPNTLRSGMESRIRREMANAAAGKPAHIIFKMNSLVDRRMVPLLYEASQAGVRIDLLVRGVCTLKPGVEGVSENITVTSLVSRFLEHTRIYWFRNNGRPEVLIGSGDLMTRNMDRRVEVLAPIIDRALVRRLKSILDVYLADNAHTRELAADGTYALRQPNDGEAPVDAQVAFLSVAERRLADGAARR